MLRSHGDEVNVRSFFARFFEIVVCRMGRLLVNSEFFQCAFYGGIYRRHINGAVRFCDCIRKGRSCRINGTPHSGIEKSNRRLWNCRKQQSHCFKFVACFGPIRSDRSRHPLSSIVEHTTSSLNRRILRLVVGIQQQTVLEDVFQLNQRSTRLDPLSVPEAGHSCDLRQLAHYAMNPRSSRDDIRCPLMSLFGLAKPVRQCCRFVRCPGCACRSRRARPRRPSLSLGVWPGPARPAPDGDRRSKCYADNGNRFLQRTPTLAHLFCPKAVWAQSYPNIRGGLHEIAP